MASDNKLLYSQTFTGTTIDVTHNLNRYNLDARVIVGGTSRPDLIDSVEFASVEPRNGFIMRLTSSNTGVLQLLDTTKYPLNLLSPTDYLKLLALPDPSSIIDSYVTGATLNTTTLSLGRNQGLSAVTVDLASIDTNSYVTGVTLNSTTLEIERNDGLADVTVDLASLSTLSPVYFRCVSTSTADYNETAQVAVPWDGANIKSAGITHSTGTNPERIEVDEDGTYDLWSTIYYIANGASRQSIKLTIWVDGVEQTDVGVGQGGYTRNTGGQVRSMSSIRTLLELTAGQYVEVYGSSDGNTSETFMVANRSNVILTKLSGVKGATGPAGVGSTIIVQKDDVTVGTVTDTLNFEGSGVSTVVDEGSNKTTVTIAGGGGGTFGSEYDSGEDLSEQVTSSTSEQNALTITTPSVPAGDYRVGWSFEWKGESEKEDFLARVRVDDSDPNIMDMMTTVKGGNKWGPTSGFGNITFGSSGTHTIDVDWWSGDSGNDASIRKTRLEFWRIS